MANEKRGLVDITTGLAIANADDRYLQLDQSTPQTAGSALNPISKIYTTDLTSANTISGSVTGNAATVTTNANLTGVVTSVGNATSIASGAIKGNMLQSAAADLGAADVTIDLGNTNGSYVTNLTTDGTITATTGFTGNVSGSSGSCTGNSATVTGLSVVSGKTLTVNNILTIAGTDSTTMTFPSTSATIARTDAANTFTGVQTMTAPVFDTSIQTPIIKPAADSTTAVQVMRANGTTPLIICDTTNNRVGINTPTAKIDGSFVVSSAPVYSDGMTSSVVYYGASTTTASAATLAIRKSNSDTLGTLTATIDGQTLGSLSWYGVKSDNSAFVASGTITATQDGVAGAARVPMKMEFKVNPDGTSTLLVPMTIRATGNIGLLGIGTPTARLMLPAGKAAASTAPLKLTQASAVVLSTPEAGAIECNDGDDLYYTIKTGTTRKTISYNSTGYGEMYMYDNATACVINTANIYHAVFSTWGNNDGTLAPNIDSSYFTFTAGFEKTATAYVDYNGTVAGTTKVTTSTNHGLNTGDPISITGTTNYNGVYLITNIDATNFYIVKAYVADDATGSVRRPGTLKALKTGVYEVTFNVSGIAANANDVFKWELNKGITPLDNVITRSIWTSGTNYRSSAASGIVSLTVNQFVWMSVKNYSGANNLTIESANVFLHKV